MNTVHVGVAGNIEPHKHVPAAMESLRANFDVLKEAPVYGTDPIGRPAQDTYWNTMVILRAEMEQEELHQVLQGLEIAAGRVRTTDRYAARTLDLDILLWNGEPPNDEARSDIEERPWNQWCLHHLGAWPKPESPEPDVA